MNYITWYLSSDKNCVFTFSALPRKLPLSWRIQNSQECETDTPSYWQQGKCNNIVQLTKDPSADLEKSEFIILPWNEVWCSVMRVSSWDPKIWTRLVRRLFRYQIFIETGSETFFGNKFSVRPVSRLFFRLFGTKFFGDFFRDYFFWGGDRDRNQH